MKKGPAKINKKSEKRSAKQQEWYSFGEVFGKVSKSKTFQQAYDEEMSRLLLARQIRENRIKRKLTQEAVAKRVGMPQSVIARIESGSHSFSFDTLARIAHVFGKKVVLA